MNKLYLVLVATTMVNASQPALKYDKEQLKTLKPAVSRAPASMAKGSFKKPNTPQNSLDITGMSAAAKLYMPYFPPVKIEFTGDK